MRVDFCEIKMLQMCITLPYCMAAIHHCMVLCTISGQVPHRGINLRDRQTKFSADQKFHLATSNNHPDHYRIISFESLCLHPLPVTTQRILFMQSNPRNKRGHQDLLPIIFYHFVIKINWYMYFIVYEIHVSMYLYFVLLYDYINLNLIVTDFGTWIRVEDAC